jgi:hypothetical protein
MCDMYNLKKEKRKKITLHSEKLSKFIALNVITNNQIKLAEKTNDKYVITKARILCKLHICFFYGVYRQNFGFSGHINKF